MPRANASRRIFSQPYFIHLLFESLFSNIVSNKAEHGKTSALIEMYANCGSILEAQQVFAIGQARSLIKWTSLISGYARNEETVQKTFSTMMVSNIVSWNGLV